MHAALLLAAALASAPAAAAPRAIAHYLEARRLLRGGDPERAAAELRQAIAFDERSPELRVTLARTQLELGRLDGAAEAARAALELGAAGATAVEAQVLVARVHLARREADGAIDALGRAIALAGAAPEPPAEPWRLLADVHAGAGRTEAAERVLEDLARAQPADAAAGYRDLGRRGLDDDDPSAAERHLRRATVLDPGDVEAFRLLGAAREALRRPREAREAHLAALRLDPDDPGTLMSLGRLSLAEGEPEAAREWFRRLVRIAPDQADAHVRVAFAWLGDERAAEALHAARGGLAEAGPDPRLRLAEGLALRALRRFLEAAKALEPVPPAAGEIRLPARVAYGECLSRAGRHAEAERAFVEALALRPGELRLVTARARALVRAGRAAEAVPALRASLDAADHPEPVGLLEAYADALVEADRAPEALGLLRRALEDRPRDVELAYALGAALERAGQPEAALAQMRALLVLDPGHAEALNFSAYVLSNLSTGAPDARRARLEEAEVQARRALALAPRAGHVHDTLGWVLHRRGDDAGAERALSTALELAGPDPTVLEHLADVQRALGRTADAIASLRRALGEHGDDAPREEARRKASVERKLRELGARSARGRVRPDDVP
ncbi:MAG: tetratricopeptide repeat protein [Anaeromyxobacteraceae bacterium]